MAAATEERRAALRARRQAFFARKIDFIPCRQFLAPEAEALASTPDAAGAGPTAPWTSLRLPTREEYSTPEVRCVWCNRGVPRPPPCACVPRCCVEDNTKGQMSVHSPARNRPRQPSGLQSAPTCAPPRTAAVPVSQVYGSNTGAAVRQFCVSCCTGPVVRPCVGLHNMKITQW